MLYCKIENDIIGNPTTLKNLLKNVVNPSYLSTEELNQRDVYEYQEPGYDIYTEKLGNLYFNDDTKIVSRNILARDYDIDKEKDDKINQLKSYVSSLLKSTDHYFIRKLDRNIDVPDYIKTERNYINDQCDVMKVEIRNMTNIRNVKEYDFKINNLTYHEVYSHDI